MIQRLFRATALILLLFSLATFSGITATASALLFTQTIDSCCGPVADPERTPADPCSQGDCACLFCLSGEELRPFAWLGRHVDITALLPLPPRLQPHDFVAAIDYPPEIA